jgi:hypothetical protein
MVLRPKQQHDADHDKNDAQCVTLAHGLPKEEH